MATLREYFDTDFAHAARLHIKFPTSFPNAEAVVLYDFSGHVAYLSCYVCGSEHNLEDHIQLIEALAPGQPAIFDDKVTLPSARMFPGVLRVENRNPVILRARFHGDSEWISSDEIPTSTRLFVYSESLLTEAEVSQLKEKGKNLGHLVQFRSTRHAEERSRFEKPLAFISHDSRDKEVAKQIAIGLQKMQCPVWYDEFSLKVGANLRDSIEGGLKNCQKCVLLLSPNFFSNGGWTKKEFDSIFTREITEQRQIVLPVWYGVGKESVYAYSPSLLNVMGVEWNRVGKDEVCRRLYNAILDQSSSGSWVTESKT